MLPSILLYRTYSSRSSHIITISMQVRYNSIEGSINCLLYIRVLYLLVSSVDRLSKVFEYRVCCTLDFTIYYTSSIYLSLKVHEHTELLLQLRTILIIHTPFLHIFIMLKSCLFDFLFFLYQQCVYVCVHQSMEYSIWIQRQIETYYQARKCLTL